MREIVFDQKKRVKNFLARKDVIPESLEIYEAIGIEQDGIIVAGVVYDNFDGDRCFMHCASDAHYWLTKDFLWYVFDYPFNQLGMEVIVVFVSSNNEKALKMNKHLGFKEECRIKHGFKDGDMVILSMYKNECKYLRNKDETL
jgi:RimJ/RimL family protein N-acetyltransferase